MRLIFFISIKILLLLNIVNIAFAETYKIGVILPLSGDLAHVGLELRRGIELAYSKTLQERFEIIFEDNQSFNKVAAVNAVQKLININKIDLILIDAVNTVSALDPILEKKNIPSLIIWDSNNKISNLKSKAFGFGFSTEFAGEEMAFFAFNKLKNKTVSVVSIQDEWSEIISKSFIDKFKLLGGKITSNETIPLNQTDLRTITSKIISKNPDGVYFPLFGQTLISLVKQLKAQGYKGKLLTGDGFGGNDIKILGKNAENIYVSQIYLADPSFKELYIKKYGANDIVNLSFAALSYDAFKFAFSTINNLESKNKLINFNNINNGFRELKFSGFTGKIDFSKNRLSSKRELIYIVKDRELNLPSL
jgi:branched-chain amino acid transport system substrate-binding protein